MLESSDLQTFAELVEHAQSQALESCNERPKSLLRPERDLDGRLHRNEIGRLQRSLKIACVANDIPELTHRVLNTIAEDLSEDGRAYVPFSESNAWLKAICWALSKPPPVESEHLPHGGQTRQYRVGTACRRLRERSYDVTVNANGPYLDTNTRFAIARDIDSLVAQIGGLDAVHQLCSLVRAQGRIYDGMWLFGNFFGGFRNAPNAAVPIGWLMSLAVRNIHRKRSTAQPCAIWKSAENLVVDFAASLDCQRYNPFDGIYLQAPDFLRALDDALKWRELFTLPQLPSVVLGTVRAAFADADWPADCQRLHRDVDQLFDELGNLVSVLRVDRPTLITRSRARANYPFLYRHALARPDTDDTQELDPFSSYRRSQERRVFFEADDAQLVSLPRSLTAAAGCTATFTLVFETLGSEIGGRLVGPTVERCIAVACREHRDTVWENEEYRVGKKKFEIDVAVRADEDIVLLEAKAKPLTSAARSGGNITLIKDYSESFLAMLTQLVRHDRNIKGGLTPLVRPDDDLNSLRITKVAVSPLSFGPVSDHVNAAALVQSILYARLAPKNGSPETNQILEEFNQMLDKIVEEIESVAINETEKLNLSTYLLDVFWLDLGQLLYALHRGRSVVHGVTALRSLTFQSQDCTRIAFLSNPHQPARITAEHDKHLFLNNKFMIVSTQGRCVPLRSTLQKPRI